MSLTVWYGSYRHDPDEVEYTIATEVLVNEAQTPYALRVTWHLQGVKQAADRASLVAALGALERAYSVWNQPLRVLDDGGGVVNSLPVLGSLSGVRVTHPPGYPRGQGGELGDYRSYEITVTADYPGSGPLGPAALPLKSFRESVHFAGGGPRLAELELVNAPPDVQVVYLYTAYRATQAGSAVGLLAYPPVPPPLWPAALAEAGEPQYESPKYANGVWTDWAVSWSYRFVSATPLLGYPTRWPAA